jgi:dTDP-4-amino-4,6-dideoxygalactose transaminase
MIPLHKTYIATNQSLLVNDAFEKLLNGNNDHYINLCENFLQENYQFKKVILTSSCTHALELTALLLNIKPGDEVIVPSYTFVSSANAFSLHGAKIVFADCDVNYPIVTSKTISPLITSNTKAIVLVHYAGISYDIENLVKLSKELGIALIEDAAHAIHAKHGDTYLGNYGDFATFSFHHTKSVSCGEGGALIINNPIYIDRAEILTEKGTNRRKFLNGEISKYEWVDVGSSFSLSDFSAAILYSQLLDIDIIHSKRRKIWDYYFHSFKVLEEKGWIQLPNISVSSEHNANSFFIICKTIQHRDDLMFFLKTKNITAAFHYIPLHLSPYIQTHQFNSSQLNLPNTLRFSDCLLRLPLYPDLSEVEYKKVAEEVLAFFQNQ